MRRGLPITIVSWLAFLAPAFGQGNAPPPRCGLCCMGAAQSWRQRIEEAQVVFLGTFADPRKGPGGEFTNVLVDEVLKGHDLLGPKKLLTTNRYVAIDPNAPKRWLIFCDTNLGILFDIYSATELHSETAVEYVKGAIQLNSWDRGGQIQYFLRYAEDRDGAVSEDAFLELSRNCDYEKQDLSEVAYAFPAEKLRAWIRNPNTPPHRRDLYAVMLGHCGLSSDAAILRDQLTAAKARERANDGLLIGLTLVDSDQGWNFIESLFRDPKKDFLARYGALRTARYLWDRHPNVVDRRILRNGVCLLLDDPNFADLAIDCLRIWKCWSVTSRVLALAEQPSHNTPIVRRSILRFALDSPPIEDTVAFLGAQRRKNAGLVAHVAELLEMEK